MGSSISRERTAIGAGIEAAHQMVLTAAVMIKVRGDARAVRQQAAAAALHGLAEGAKVLLLGAEGTHQTRTPKGEAVNG